MSSASRRCEVCRERPVARRSRSARNSPGSSGRPGGHPSTTHPIAGTRWRGATPEQELPKAMPTDVFACEPDEKTVLGPLLPHSLNFRVHQYLLEAKASAHSARMVARQSATDNAQQLIKNLTLEYNKLRQSNITNELLEIATAQMAVG